MPRLLPVSPLEKRAMRKKVLKKKEGEVSGD